MEDPICQVTWSFDHVVMWKIIKLISAVQQHPWQPNLGGRWLRMRDTIHQVTWTFDQVVKWSLFVKCFWNICCYSLDNVKFTDCSVIYNTSLKFWDQSPAPVINVVCKYLREFLGTSFGVTTLSTYCNIGYISQLNWNLIAHNRAGFFYGFEFYVKLELFRSN